MQEVEVDDEVRTDDVVAEGAELNGHAEPAADDEQPRRTLADLAADEPEAGASTEADEADDEQQRLFGTESKITGSVKGARPTTSSVKFKAAPVTVQGQFQPDDVLELRVLARLDKVEFPYTRDRAGNVKGVKRVHHASAISVEQVLDGQRQQDVYAKAAAILDVDAETLSNAMQDALAAVALGD